MNNYDYHKFFIHEHIDFKIEFCCLNEKYICQKMYKNQKLIFFKALNSFEREFYWDCYDMYYDFLKNKGFKIESGENNAEIQ